jgi:pyruvate kinase
MTRKRVSLHWRRTKIIATLGPATDDAASIKSMIKAGVNVFRLNMSHGTHDQHRASFRRIRKIATGLDAHVAILMDLCGPKIRAGMFKNGEVTLKKNSSVIISCNNVVGEEGLIPSRYPSLYKDVAKGERVLLDDGNLELRVTKVIGKEVHCKVIFGGTLKDNKGINLPDTKVSVSSFTAKDKNDVTLAMELGADFVALSFVRSAKDINSLKNFMKRNGEPIPVIAKIEKPEAVANIDEILKASYGIMIARGDLGIELPAEQVPLTQRTLITSARHSDKPVIVATQILESMVTNARPTRAEVGDVANAALLGTDAVMLSEETAIGQYPLRAIKVMDSILREIEARQWEQNMFTTDHTEKIVDEAFRIREAVSHAVTSLAQDLKLQGIIVPTRSGTTATILAANRPSAPLIGVSTSDKVCRKMILHWGIVPVQAEEKDTRDWKALSTRVSHKCKLTESGNSILLVSGFSKVPELNEPALKIIKV